MCVLEQGGKNKLNYNTYNRTGYNATDLQKSSNHRHPNVKKIDKNPIFINPQRMQTVHNKNKENKQNTLV